MKPFELQKLVRIRDDEPRILFEGNSAYETPEILLEFSPFLRSGDTLVMVFRQFDPARKQWVTKTTERFIP